MKMKVNASHKTAVTGDTDCRPCPQQNQYFTVSANAKKMTRYLLITIFLISGYQITIGQNNKIDYSNDLYNRTLNYYVDSTINKIYHWEKVEWNKFPQKYQFVKYMVVGDKSIINILPDTIQNIIWTKISPVDFCKLKKLKNYNGIVFISPAHFDNSKTIIAIGNYYTQQDNCQIVFDVGYNFIYHYDLTELKYKLESIESQILIIK